MRDTNIAEAEKEKEMKVATFKRDQDTARAEADQAYSIHEARAKQNVVEEQMKVELVRKEREIDLEGKEILRREKQYDAEVKKKPMQTVTQLYKRRKRTRRSFLMKLMLCNTVLKRKPRHMLPRNVWMV